MAWYFEFLDEEFENETTLKQNIEEFEMMDRFCIASLNFKDEKYLYKNEEYYLLEYVLALRLRSLVGEDADKLSVEEQKQCLEKACYEDKNTAYLFWLRNVYKSKLKMLESTARSYLNEFLVGFNALSDAKSLSLDFGIFVPCELPFSLKYAKVGVKFIHNINFEIQLNSYFKRLEKLFAMKFKLFVEYQLSLFIKDERRKLQHKQSQVTKSLEIVYLKENYRDFLRFQALRALGCNEV